MAVGGIHVNLGVSERIRRWIPPDAVLYFVSGSFALTGLVVLASLSPDLPLYELLFEGFMNVGLAVAIVAGTLYLRQDDLPRGSLWTVFVGYLAGVLFIWLLVVWAHLGDLLAGASLLTLRNDLVFFGNLGGVFGFTAGVSKARNAYNKQLRRELESNRELVESSQEALWMVRPDWSEVLYVNSAYEDIFGQPTETLEDDPVAFMGAVHPDDRDTLRQFMDRLSAEESAEVEIRVNADEDFGRWVWIQGQPVYKDGDLHAISGFTHDITERKDRQRRFEAIFNQTYQFTGLMNPDGTLIEVNDTALEYVGAERREVLGKPLWETPWFQYDDSAREIARESVAVGRDGEFYRSELTVSGVDGGRIVVDYSVRPVTDESGEVVLLVPEGRDISDRKEHEDRLLTLHETTRELFRADSVAEAADITTRAARDIVGLPINTLFLYDESEDALVPVQSTPEAENLFGSIPAITSGGGIAWQVYETSEPRVYDDVSDDPERLNPATQMRSELLLPLGDHGIFLAGSTEVGIFDYRQVSLAKLLASNVEAALDRIEVQRDLQERQRQLERQNERLDEFAGLVSHDLRNPLTVAKGNLQFAREDADSEELRTIGDALDRMATLIDDLLTLARAGDVIDELQVVDLERLAESCWWNVDTEGAELEVEAGMTVRADESRLAQLFENLFRNAIEHGGNDVTIRVGILDDGSGFFVEDDGPGIPPDQREDVFEAGMSTSSGGTGFGLSIVQQIAESHGWDVSATDGTDGGARFEITGVELISESAQTV